MQRTMAANKRWQTSNNGTIDMQSQHVTEDKGGHMDRTAGEDWLWRMSNNGTTDKQWWSMAEERRLSGWRLYHDEEGGGAIVPPILPLWILPEIGGTLLCQFCGVILGRIWSRIRIGFIPRSLTVILGNPNPTSILPLEATILTTPQNRR